LPNDGLGKPTSGRACPTMDLVNQLPGELAQRKIGQTNFRASLPNDGLGEPTSGRACPTMDWVNQLPGELAQFGQG